LFRRNITDIVLLYFSLGRNTMPEDSSSSSSAAQLWRPFPYESANVGNNAGSSANLLGTRIAQVVSSSEAIDLSKNGAHRRTDQHRALPYDIAQSQSLRKKRIAHWDRQCAAPRQLGASTAERNFSAVYPLAKPQLDLSLFFIPAAAECANVVQQDNGGASTRTSEYVTAEVLGEFDLTAEHICEIASSMNGNDTLSTLEIIARHWNFLFHHIGLTKQQICDIAKNKYGAYTLKTIIRYWPFLSSPQVGLRKEQILAIARDVHRSSLQQIFVKIWHFLDRPQIDLAPSQIYEIAIAKNGAEVLEALAKHWHFLTSAEVHFTQKQICEIAIAKNGIKILNALKENWDFCRSAEVRFTQEQIFSIVRTRDGANALNILPELWRTLHRTIGLSREQIFMIAKSQSAAKKLRDVASDGPVLMRNDADLTPSDIYDLTIHHKLTR